MKFKVGDKVQVTKEGLFTTGRIGTVSHVAGKVQVTFPSNKGVVRFSPSSLSLVNDQNSVNGSVIYQLSIAFWDEEDYNISMESVIDDLVRDDGFDETLVFTSIEEVEEEIQHKATSWDYVAGLLNGKPFLVKKELKVEGLDINIKV